MGGAACALCRTARRQHRMRCLSDSVLHVRRSCVAYYRFCSREKGNTLCVGKLVLRNNVQQHTTHNSLQGKRACNAGTSTTTHGKNIKPHTQADNALKRQRREGIKHETRAEAIRTGAIRAVAPSTIKHRKQESTRHAVKTRNGPTLVPPFHSGQIPS